MKSSLRYLVCSVPRSGTNLLSYLLSSTGRVGMRDSTKGTEHLIPHVLNDFRQWNWHERGPREFFEQRFLESATSNGAAGFKVMWRDLDLTIRNASRALRDPSLTIEAIERYLPRETRFIYLIRRDEYKQAVSWCKALQTDVWTSQHQPRGAAVYDYLRLEYLLHEIRSHHAGWRRFFERTGVEPLTLYYEDYVRDLKGSLERIGDFLGVCVEDATAPTRQRLQRQSDPTNELWLEQFHRDRRSPMARVRAAAAGICKPEPWKVVLQRFGVIS